MRKTRNCEPLTFSVVGPQTVEMPVSGPASLNLKAVVKNYGAVITWTQPDDSTANLQLPVEWLKAATLIAEELA